MEGRGGAGGDHQTTRSTGKPLLDERAETASTKENKKREGTRRQHKACGESTQHKVENNVKDDQIQNDVMGEKRADLLLVRNSQGWVLGPMKK